MTDLIAGRYELEARISKGGMGAVWRARDRRLRRDVAVKLLHSWIAEDLELRRRFAREARVLAPLVHEHIVRLYDYGEDGETPFLVMELVDGANLADVARNRELGWAEASEIALPIASALAYAHARGIVHRDLTPGNVLIESASGRVVVSDFGLARIARSATSVTTQGMLLGTPEYWSPEQARGADSETATDMYALGCLLFWLLAGRTPFEGDDRLAVGLRRAHETAPPLALVRTGRAAGGSGARRRAALGRSRRPADGRRGARAARRGRARDPGGRGGHRRGGGAVDGGVRRSRSRRWCSSRRASAPGPQAAPQPADGARRRGHRGRGRRSRSSAPRSRMPTASSRSHG